MKTYAPALSDILYRQGTLSKEDAAAIARDFTQGEPAQLNYFLLDQGVVNKPDLLRALSQYYQVPFFDARGYQFNHDLLELFPQDVLVRNAILPIEFDGNILTVVAGQPDAPELRNILREYTQNHIEFRVGITRDIVDEIRAYYDNPPSQEEIEQEEDENDFTDIVDVV